MNAGDSAPRKTGAQRGSLMMIDVGLGERTGAILPLSGPNAE